MTRQEARLLQDDYTLGHSAEEHERLRRQGQMLEAATRRVVHAVGLRRGGTCLDVGCGPGAIMKLMGELVGPSGEGTGIDRDAGREAVERLAATGTSRYRFIEADMEDTDEIGGELFDLTFAPLALLYSPGPVAPLPQMYSLKKTSGYIAVADYYLRPHNVHPKH